jgi:DNA-binding transcriptional LysR family regulator
MDIRQLKYFRTIVEEGQISRAAHKLHMAQPPLSLQLKLLEQELGVQLIERNSRSLRPTNAGFALYQRAEQILDMVDSAVREIREFEQSVHGVLAIGSPQALGQQLMPERIRRFHDAHPGVSFQWREGNTFRVLELLDAHLIELGVVRLPVPDRAYDAIHLLTEPWVAVARKDDRRYSRRKGIPLAELGKLPLLLMNRREGIRSHDMVIDELRAAGISPNIVCESDNVLALLSLVDAGMGVAILPESTLTLRPGEFRLLQITGCVLESSVAIVWQKGRRLSTAAGLFLDTFR